MAAAIASLRALMSTLLECGIEPAVQEVKYTTAPIPPPRVCYDSAVPSGVRLGVAIPQTILAGAFDVRGLRGFLSRAEALGFESAWVVEQILGSIRSLEPVTLLTYAAAITERLRLGSAVLLTALRSPVHLAKSLTTLDHLSGGRLIVGVGLGANQPLYPAFGIPTGGRAERFAEGVRLMKRLWTESRVTFDGRFWKLTDATM